MVNIDEIIFSAALARAKRLLELGCMPEEAADKACPRSWSDCRDRVLEEIKVEHSNNWEGGRL